VFGSLEVGKDNLRRIIGPQGSVIKGLEADSGSRLSIDDAGLVHIYSPAREYYRKAVSAIEGITGASLRVGCLFSDCPSDMLTMQHSSQLFSSLMKVRA
jgi:polyribonucleotide nucleotidyltransferase